MSDMINHPKHYIVNGLEAIDVIRSRLTDEEFIGYLKGNILKYDLRASFKGSLIEDLEKSTVYKDWLIDIVEDKEVINSPELDAKFESLINQD
jgi:hypothetical protein